MSELDKRCKGEPSSAAARIHKSSHPRASLLHRSARHIRFASTPASSASTTNASAAEKKSRVAMKDEQGRRTRDPGSCSGDVSPAVVAKTMANTGVCSDKTVVSTASTTTAGSRPRAVSEKHLSLRSPRPLDHDSALRRVQDLEQALASSRAHQHRMAMELESLRMQQPSETTTDREPSSSPPGRPASVPSMFQPPSLLPSPPGGGPGDYGLTDLMAEAARNCSRMEDRLVFQKQIVQLRDKIYEQEQELSKRKREKDNWNEEKEGLIRDLRSAREQATKTDEKLRKFEGVPP